MRWEDRKPTDNDNKETANVQRMTVNRVKDKKLNCQVRIIKSTTLKSIFKWCY